MRSAVSAGLAFSGRARLSAREIVLADCARHLAEAVGSLTECNYRLLIRELLPN
jgi:hypothetical protein